MKKRFVSLLIAACMIFALLPVSAITAFAKEPVLTGYCGADSSYPSQTYNYSVEYKNIERTFTGTYYGNAIWTLTPNGENTYKLTISGTGAMGDLKGWAFGNPWNFELIQKLKVAVDDVYYAVTELEIADGITEIGAHAFEAHRAITHVALPQSVTKIGEKSFNYCTGMQSIELSNNLEEIGSTALSDTSLTSIELPESLKKIQNGAFSGCKLLAGDLKIPSNVTVIGNSAFANDTALTGTLTIGNSVQTIGDSAFSGCKFTGKLTIPDSVISIGDSAFTNNKFSEISLGRNLEKIGGSAFNTSGTYTGQLNIPDSVKEIGKSAFNGMGFTSIRLGKSVSSIADTAFQNCTSIHSLDISSIGSADYGTNVFKSLKNPNTIYVNSEEQKNTITNQITENRSVFAITNGGVFAENTTFEEGKLATPEKAGYTFDGWYENADFTGEAVTTPVKGKTYYAKWTKNKYTVTLDNNGHGEQPAAMPPVEHGAPVTDLPKKLSDSTNEWVFTGWYTDAECTTEYKNEPITKAITLYAGWRKYTNTSLTAKVSKSDYLVNTPADVNVTVTPGDDIGKLMQDKDNIKISLTYDDDVTSVMLNGKVLERKEYTISELMPLMGQNRKLDVTYGKAGTHTFGIALKNGNKIVSECGTNIVVAEEAAELTPATKLYTLTVKNADVTIKNGDEEIKAEKNDKGELIAKVPEKADVTVTYTSQSDAVAFDQWTITTDETLDVDVKNNPLKFQMPDGGVTIEAMTKDASIEEDEPNILGTAAVVGTAAVGTAILAWQGYQLGTELYLKTALPAGTAIPTNRAELALLVWNHAGKPAPAAVLPADATDTQKAIAWAVENDLLKAAKDNGETYVDTDSVSRVEVIRVWNKAQEK